MSSYRVVVVTHPELVPGFKLAGVAVEEANSVSEAEDFIESVLKSSVNEFGIILIDEDIAIKINEKLLNALEERGLPLLIPFPAKEVYSWQRVKKEEDYTSYLIRNAIGYKIKLK